jgi:hypothetical protein
VKLESPSVKLESPSVQLEPCPQQLSERLEFFFGAEPRPLLYSPNLEFDAVGRL